MLLQLLHLKSRRLVVHLQNPDEVGDCQHSYEPENKLLNEFRHLFGVNPRDVISQVIEYYFADVVRKRREVRHLFHHRFSVSEALQKVVFTMLYAQNYYFLL